jgi:protein SCO1/2
MTGSGVPRSCSTPSPQDIRPATLSNISGWLDEPGPEVFRLKVVFISLDPKRDAPVVLTQYVSAIDGRFTGTIGPHEPAVFAYAKLTRMLGT